VKNRLGETRHLRKLLAPVTSRTDSPRQLVKIKHVKIEDLDRDVLADARLVVVAGIADPGTAVPLLREYVLQGGQLILAAGGEFNIENWNDSAWLDGAGILPAELKRDAIGAMPDEAREVVKPFTLSFESLGTHDYFRLADASEEELRDLYAEPYFFKAVAADVSPAALEDLKKKVVERLEKTLTFEAEAAVRRAKLSAASGNGVDDEVAADEQKLAELHPAWLLWKSAQAEDAPAALPDEPEARAAQLATLAEQSLPTPRARFADEAGTPYLVERKIGKGQVLFVASGLLSPWNTLPKTNTFLIYDRIMRRMIESTLPNRNFEPVPEIKLPVPADDQLVTVSLRRPGHEDAPEVLDRGFIGPDVRGVSVSLPLARGLYRITALGTDAPPGKASEPGTTSEADRPLWELPLSVNGRSDESNLSSLSRDKFQERVGDANLLWVGANEEISLAGSQIKGQTMWWYLVVALLFLLFVEMAILAGPMLFAKLNQPGAPA
jgi:hypothetical protein